MGEPMTDASNICGWLITIILVLAFAVLIVFSYYGTDKQYCTSDEIRANAAKQLGENVSVSQGSDGYSLYCWKPQVSKDETKVVS